MPLIIPERPVLEDLPFRDIYLSGDGNVEARFNPLRRPQYNDLPKNAAVPEEFRRCINDLINQAEEYEPGRRDFALQLDTMRVRVIRTVSYDGYREYCFRKLPNDIPAFDQLNYDAEFTEESMSWCDRDGLILVMGKTGSGKTTMIMSLLDLWCDEPGGVTLTIEDPVEFKLRKTGHGFKTIQWEAKSPDEWPAMVNDCLRYAPDTVLCGEVRTPATAAAVINLAGSGHRVIASVHGSSIAAGIQRFLGLAQGSEMGLAANDAFAEAFIGAAWQKIENGKPVVDFLPTVRDGTTDPCRQYIRNGDLKMIPGIITRLKNARQNDKLRGVRR